MGDPKHKPVAHLVVLSICQYRSTTHWQSGGHGFDPRQLHQQNKRLTHFLKIHFSSSKANICRLFADFLISYRESFGNVEDRGTGKFPRTSRELWRFQFSDMRVPHPLGLFFPERRSWVFESMSFVEYATRGQWVWARRFFSSFKIFRTHCANKSFLTMKMDSTLSHGGCSVALS